MTLGSRAADYLNLAFLIPQTLLIPKDQYFGLISSPRSYPHSPVLSTSRPEGLIGAPGLVTIKIVHFSLAKLTCMCIGLTFTENIISPFLANHSRGRGVSVIDPVFLPPYNLCRTSFDFALGTCIFNRVVPRHFFHLFTRKSDFYYRPDSGILLFAKKRKFKADLS